VANWVILGFFGKASTLRLPPALWRRWFPTPILAFWSFLRLVGSMHALKSCCCHQGSLCNNRGKLGVFGIFREGFKSWLSSSSVAEVVRHSKFGFLVFSWVGWIHACTEIMLLPLWTIAQHDNGAISPVIQTTSGSRVPSSRPRTDVRPRGKDAMSNAEHKVERKR